ncbi:MAG: effector binding domain-containing protein, partial [Oscillospiraceae bacterium]|nr:effector binding domain-containing protein [Oscillospiraceae bacterium]
MDLLTISEISRQLGVSTRTLRYYEQIGLISPVWKEDYAYRSYDAATAGRLRQIVFLRKLRIPLRRIAEVLDGYDVGVAMAAFMDSLREIGDEIAALTTVRDAIRSLLDRLRLDGGELGALDDASLTEIADSLAVPNTVRKEGITMDELGKAGEVIGRLTDRDVRIVRVPPATVAASHYIGDNPEMGAAGMMDGFIKKAGLAGAFPGARCFGFNHPNPGMRGDGKYGYEFWVTIPEGMEVGAPLTKKSMGGGLYAAYMILM